MTRRVVFVENLAFGQLEMPDYSAPIPSWLLDKPDVIAALAIIAKNGGTAAIRKAPDFHDVVVDLDAASISYVEGKI